MRTALAKTKDGGYSGGSPHADPLAGDVFSRSTAEGTLERVSSSESDTAIERTGLRLRRMRSALYEGITTQE